MAAPKDAPAVTAQDLGYRVECQALYGGTGGVHLIKVLCPKLDISSLTPAVNKAWFLLSEDKTSRLWLNSLHIKSTKRRIRVWLRLELTSAAGSAKFTDYLEVFDCTAASGAPLQMVEYDANGIKVGEAEDAEDLWISLLSPKTAAIVRSRLCADVN